MFTLPSSPAISRQAAGLGGLWLRECQQPAMAQHPCSPPPEQQCHGQDGEVGQWGWFLSGKEVGSGEQLQRSSPARSEASPRTLQPRITLHLLTRLQ